MRSEGFELRMPMAVRPTASRLPPKDTLFMHQICSPKKVVSAHQHRRTLGVTYKAAWFMSHRIRETMTDTPTEQLGDSDTPVEADETFWGNNKRRGAYKVGREYQHKVKIVSLVERGGKPRSFVMPAVNGETLNPILKAHIAKAATLNTVEHGAYRNLGQHYALTML